MVDGVEISEEGVYGVYEKDNKITISEPGTYVLNGEYNGKFRVKLNDPDGHVTLILDGVTITNPSGTGLLITSAHEIDERKDYNRTNRITYEQAKNLDFSDVGIRIVLADDSINTVDASHDEKHDSSFFSKISMVIEGEKKGNGILNVIGDTEGLDTKKHMLIKGGVINISAQDDGINASKEYGSVVIIDGGKLTIHAGIGKEGDGIDSNGMLIINGGEVISAGDPKFDAGLDGSAGIFINGGKVIGVGSSLDGADEADQPTMNLNFDEEIAPNSELTIIDADGNKLFNFCPQKAGFDPKYELENYKAAIVSHPDFKLDTVYHIYIDGEQLGFTGNKHMMPFPTGGNWGPPPGIEQGGWPPGNQEEGGWQPGDGAPPGWGNWGNDDTSEEEDGTLKTDFILTKSMLYFSGITKVPK